MTTARDTIVDALDIESFVLCESELGSAPAPGAVFRALAKNIERTKIFRMFVSGSRARAERGARSATPGAGVLPKHLLRANLLSQPKFIL